MACWSGCSHGQRHPREQRACTHKHPSTYIAHRGWVILYVGQDLFHFYTSNASPFPSHLCNPAYFISLLTLLSIWHLHLLCCFLTMSPSFFSILLSYSFLCCDFLVLLRKYQVKLAALHMAEARGRTVFHPSPVREHTAGVPMAWHQCCRRTTSPPLLL